MDKYNFSVTIDHKKYDIKSDFNDYEIWNNDKLLFVLFPAIDGNNNAKWQLRGPSMADSVLVEKLGHCFQLMPNPKSVLQYSPSYLAPAALRLIYQGHHLLQVFYTLLQ